MGEQDVITQLGIERIFSTDGKFTRIDHSEVNPKPLPNGLLTILERTKRKSNLNGPAFSELYAPDMAGTRSLILSLGANAGEIIKSITHGMEIEYDVYAVQLYKI